MWGYKMRIQQGLKHESRNSLWRLQLFEETKWRQTFPCLKLKVKTWNFSLRYWNKHVWSLYLKPSAICRAILCWSVLVKLALSCCSNRSREPFWANSMTSMRGRTAAASKDTKLGWWRWQSTTSSCAGGGGGIKAKWKVPSLISHPHLKVCIEWHHEKEKLCMRKWAKDVWGTNSLAYSRDSPKLCSAVSFRGAWSTLGPHPIAMWHIIHTAKLPPTTK